MSVGDLKYLSPPYGKSVKGRERDETGEWSQSSVGKPKYPLLLFRLYSIVHSRLRAWERRRTAGVEVGGFKQSGVERWQSVREGLSAHMHLKQRWKQRKLTETERSRLQRKERGVSEWVGVRDWHRSGSGCVSLWQLIENVWGSTSNGKRVWPQEWHPVTSMCVYEVAFPERIWWCLYLMWSLTVLAERDCLVERWHTHTQSIYIYPTAVSGRDRKAEERQARWQEVIWNLQGTHRKL